MTRRISALRVLALAGLACGISSASQAFTLINFGDPVVKKVSVGAPPADDASQTSTAPRYSVSDSGCYIVFTSLANKMVPGQVEANGGNDVFLYDCQNDKVVLVSHKTGDPLTTGDKASDQPVISPDGAYVVFRSAATDLLEGGSGFTGQTNVFLWDRLANKATLVSHAFDLGGENTAGDGDSQNGVVSRAGGRPFVAFESRATNLVDPDKNGFSDVFRYDSTTGTIMLIPVPAYIPDEANGDSFHPAINADGTCIVFESAATNLVSDTTNDDQNKELDVFRWKFAGEPTSLILLSHKAKAPNQGPGAVAADGRSTEASIADDCQPLEPSLPFAFKSTAKDLTASQVDGNGGDDVFIAANSGDARLVSHRPGAAEEEGNGVSSAPILSRDGNWVAYASLADNLATIGQVDTGSPSSDVFVYEIARDINTLASHAAGDPKTVASGESFAPEISSTGLYVAYESIAKDLDPNQNDGNDDSDVFLYNRWWNNSIVASRRFASIAITGKGRSVRPALSGNGYTVAFTSNRNDLIADDPETGDLDDVFFFRSFGLNVPLSVRSTDSRNTLDWITPPTNFVSLEAFVNPGTTCPTDYATASAGVALTLPSPMVANESFQVTDAGPGGLGYPPGTDLCYSFFVERDSGPIQPVSGPVQETVVRTLEAPPGAVKWSSTVAAGVTALAQVGLGQNLVAVANDGGVYGLSRGSAGGFWSSGYWPFWTPDGKPVQGRPGVAPLSVLGSTRSVFVGSQDGRVYALDADRGSRAGGALWYTTPALGASVQPAAAGIFSLYGGVGNHILIGARATSTTAQFFALDPATGAVRGTPFDGGGTIGLVNTAASVDYGRSQVYFASLKSAPADPSVWCLKLTATGLDTPCWTPRTDPSDVSGAAIERGGVVYVGDDSGKVWVFDAVTGDLRWSFNGCGTGGVKSFVLADRGGTQNLFYAAGSTLCALTDDVTNATLKWKIDSASPIPIADPSTPILARIAGTAYVYVGSSDGYLYQVEAEDESAVNRVLLRPGATIGAPAFDVRDNMVYVGSVAGAIYAVQAPLP